MFDVSGLSCHRPTSVIEIPFEFDPHCSLLGRQKQHGIALDYFAHCNVMGSVS